MAIDNMKQIADLVTEFACCVIAQNEALRRHNPRVGNQFANRYLQAFEKIRAIGDPGRQSMSALLGDPNKDVRVMAAAFLLRFKTEEAIKVLQLEAQGNGLSALGASECLKRWEEGSWQLDPIEEIRPQ